MELTGLVGGESGSGQVQQKDGPVVIRCDYASIGGDKMDGIVQLIKVARFQASFIGEREAYVILTGVRDKSTPEEFRDRILDAYVKYRSAKSD